MALSVGELVAASASLTPRTRRKGGEFMLQEGMDASFIAAHLDDIATDRMGLDANLEHSKRVAELLLDWKTEIYTIRRRQT